MEKEQSTKTEEKTNNKTEASEKLKNNPKEKFYSECAEQRFKKKTNSESMF